MSERSRRSGTTSSRRRSPGKGTKPGTESYLRVCHRAHRIGLEHVESFVAERRQDSPAGPFAEASLRAFLECGIPRFGVARFRRARSVSCASTVWGDDHPPENWAS